MKYKGLDIDIWSSGVILYAMVCGYLPFEDDDTTILYDKIINGNFEIPKFISEGSTDLICKVLETDASKRYKISDIKNHFWIKKILLDQEIEQLFKDLVFIFFNFLNK